MKRKPNIAVVGATGVVGSTFLKGTGRKRLPVREHLHDGI